MRKTLSFTCAALLVALPSFAFAQTMQKAPPASSVPSAQQDKTPAANTPSYEGRSSATAPVDPAKPNVDGLHPNVEKPDTMKPDTMKPDTMKK